MAVGTRRYQWPLPVSEKERESPGRGWQTAGRRRMSGVEPRAEIRHPVPALRGRDPGLGRIRGARPRQQRACSPLTDLLGMYPRASMQRAWSAHHLARSSFDPHSRANASVSSRRFVRLQDARLLKTGGCCPQRPAGRLPRARSPAMVETKQQNSYRRGSLLNQRVYMCSDQRPRHRFMCHGHAVVRVSLSVNFSLGSGRLVSRG
jgi:hypothetical protein